MGFCNKNNINITVMLIYVVRQYWLSVKWNLTSILKGN
jgi:hypothetical protein